MALFSRLKQQIMDVVAVANVRKPIPPANTPVLPPTVKAANAAINALPVVIPGGGKNLPPVTHPARTVTASTFVNLRAPALTLADKIAAAERLGVTVKHINMLLAVESGGRSFDDKGRPIILFEPHIFHRRTNGKWSPSDFSYSKWGARKYPKSFDGRWAQIEAAAVRNPLAAIESASWGLFQVMGFHWEALGYPSAYAFAEAMTSGEPAQLDAMVRYIELNNLKAALRQCTAASPNSCRAFAKGYNGPSYEDNDYHTKMARALK